MVIKNSYRQAYLENKVFDNGFFSTTAHESVQNEQFEEAKLKETCIENRLK